MTSDMQIPQIDDLTNQARIVRWFKHEGEFVTDNDSLLEIEDGLSNMVIHASGAGILRNIYKQKGEVVQPGERIAGFEFFAPQPSQTDAAEKIVVPPLNDAIKPIKATESAIKFANEHQIDLSLLTDQATGENGEITDEDVIRYFTQSLLEIDNQRLTVSESDDSDSVSNTLNGILESQSPENSLAAEIEKALLAGEQEVFERKPIKIPRITNLPPEEQDTVTSPQAQTQSQPSLGVEHFSVFEAVFDFSQTENWLAKTTELISTQDSLNTFGYSAIFLKTIDWVFQHEKDFIAPFTNPEDFGIGYSFILPGQNVVHGISNLSHKTCGHVANELSTAQTRYQQGQKTPTDFQKDPKFVFLDLMTYGIDRGVSYPTGSQLAMLTAGSIHIHQIRIDPDLAQSRSTRQITLVVNKDKINEAAAIHFFHTLRTALENPSIILV